MKTMVLRMNLEEKRAVSAFSQLRTKLTALLVLAFSFVGYAQFSGDFAPANWAFNTTTAGGDGSVDVTGAPATIVLSGSDNSGIGSNQYEEYTTTILTSGFITFNYSHVNPDVDVAQYAINGAATTFASFGTGSVGPISVSAGDIFGFRVNNDDNCCGRGVLTVSNFKFCPIITLTNTATTNVSCDGLNDGTATMSASGGQTAYNYTWNVNQSTAIATALVAATYTCTVTDANGCTATQTAAITQPSALTSNTSQNSILCFNDATGIATVGPSGGTTPYSYSWGPTAGTTSSISNLLANTYTCTITDANNCSITRTVNLTQPLQITAASSSQVDVVCRGNATGTATLVPTGGIGSYLYSWSGSASTQTTGVVTGLAAGAYTCIVRDNNLCTNSFAFTITEPGALSATTNSTNILCFGNSTGAASVTASNGTGPYAYAWVGSTSTTSLATGLTSGSYTCTITDACAATTSKVFTLTQPSAGLSITPSSTDVNCFGNSTGAASVAVTGGTSAYSYSWSNAVTNSSSIASLLAGGYTCTVTDANACTLSQTFTIAQPTGPLVVASAPQTNILCKGNNTGSATVNITGGSPSYTYTWSGAASPQTASTAINLVAGNYTVNVTDSKGCTITATYSLSEPANALSIGGSQVNELCFGGTNGSATVSANGGTTNYSYAWTGSTSIAATATGIASGSYTCTVTDANACTITQTFVITEPTKIDLTPSQTNVSCNGGTNATALVSVTGGISAYSYSWSTPNGSGTGASGLAAGTYTLMVTDVNACTKTNLYTITEPAVLASNGTVTNVNCFGGTTGSVALSTTGGTTPYSYSWTNAQTGSSATGLVFGSYTVSVSDANSCSLTKTFTLTQPSAALSVSGSASTDINCFGNSTGTASVTIAGGTTPYTYTWSGAASTQSTASVSAIPSGNYTVNVTDANGCTITNTYVLTQPSAALSTSVSSQTNINCNGNNNGAATINVTGGTSAYSYSWSTPNGSGASANALVAGTYTCTVTDANSCTKSQTIVITEPAVLSATTAQGNIGCFNENTGSASVIVSGGTTAYSYSWSSGHTTSVVTGLPANSYTCTVTDANSCTLSRTFTLTQPFALTLAVSVHTNITCNGASTGLLTAAASGGALGYSYSWSNGTLNKTTSNLGIGTYTCTVTDFNGCEATVSATITQPAALSSTTNTTNIMCFGNSTGAASVTAADGTTPYSYSWSPSGGTAATASGLIFGTYTVVVTDACTASVTKSVTLTQPSAPLAISATPTNVLCNGNSTGAISVAVTGGTSAYSYSWSTPNGSGTLASGLTSGTYTVNVTDANSCTIGTIVLLTEPSAALSATTTFTNVACNGNSTGSASITVSGGTTGYTYTWSGAASTQATASVTGIPSGNYTVNVTDANGCTISKSYTLTQPSAALSITAIPTHILCNGNSTGAITVSATGGTTAYSYSWSTANGSGTSASGLASGTYTIQVTDANLCTSTVSVTLTQPSAPLSTNITSTNLSCNGSANGTATITPAGGTSGYTYSWTSGAGTNATANGLSALTYTCTVTDANGCSTTNSVTITQPTVLSVSTAKTNVACFGVPTGTATATATGGITAYSYSWSGGASTQTTSTVTGLASGSYTVKVTDANSCSTTATVSLTQPGAALSSTGSSSNLTCNGNNTGSASISVAGGTTAYTYTWSGAASAQTTSFASGLPAAGYTVNVTDANGCTLTRTFVVTEPGVLAFTATQTNVSCNGFGNGIASATNVTGGTTGYTYSWTGVTSTASSVSNLVPNTYTVTVKDANNCSLSKTVEITQPSVLSASTAQSNVSCYNSATGVASVTPLGGTTPYSYSWSPNTNSTSSATGLTANTYTCSISDANGCSITRSITITQPLQLIVTLTGQTNLDCFGASNGMATVSVTGGALGYSYSWTPAGGSSATATGLAFGTYTCNVTDFNGCTTSVSATITQPTLITATTNSVNVTGCFGNANGAASVTATGGTPSYTYLWSPSGGTGASAAGLTAGLYTCTITDTKGCTITKNFNLNQPTQVVVSSTQTNVNCFGNSTGSASVSVAGGSTPYTYSWTGVTSTLASVSGLAPNTYTCTVKDANNCTGTKAVVITQPSAGMSVTSTQTNIACFGVSSWSATVNVTGGTTAYSYSWAPSGGSTATASGFIAGTYTCTIVDAGNCSITKTVTITEPTAIIVNAGTANVSCHGGNNGSASVSVTGGVTPYTYSWTSGAGNASTASNLMAGNYSCTITDANGCSIVKAVTINEPATLATTVTQTNVSCNGGSNGSIGLSVTGGTTPYLYTWSPAGGTNATANNLSIGLYTCVVTDAKGCTLSSVNFMNQPSSLSAVMTSTGALCKGTATGSASIAVTGGNTPYTYSWTSGAGSNSSASNLAVGTYTCLVVDAKGCSTTRVSLITEPTLVSVSTTTAPQEPACGNSTGSISVAATGGTSGYTYLWSSGSITSATITGLSAGNYTVVSTDANGCTGSLVVPLSNINGPTVTGVSVDAGCVGQTNGSVSVTITTGTTPFTYSWSNGATTEDLSGLADGTYALQVIDANTCVGTGTFIVNAIALPVATTSSTDVKCNGGTDGTAAVAVSGTPSNYTYSWTNGATNDSISGLIAGSYTCTITDLTNCSSTVVVTIGEPSALTSFSITTDVYCNGGNNGTASVVVSGGTLPYDYSWSSGSVNANEINLGAGSYTCTIMDGNGCTATNVVSIDEPTALTSTSVVGNVSCNMGTNGSASVTANGGTTPYTYLWSTGGTDASIAGQMAGLYSCTIIDGNGCSTSENVSINEPTALVYSSTSNDAACNGTATGSASITISGGTTPYMYSWSNGGTDADAIELVAGSYTVTVTDANGCTVSDTYTIGEPNLLTSTSSSTNATCHNSATGTAMVVAAGGTMPYSYSWTVAGESNDNISNLVAGSYTCTITDANGCSTTNSVTIAEPTAVVVSLDSTYTPGCGLSDGAIFVSATGAAGSYTYTWTPAGGTDAAASNIPAGNYEVTVTDANGCTGTLTVVLANPAGPLVTGTATDATCNGLMGAVTVNVTGGASGYSYSWSNASTDQNLSSIAAGTYTITVTDAGNCMSTESFTVAEPAVLAVTGTATDAACNGQMGSVSVNVSGGTTAYAYSWSNASTDQNLSSIAAGTYTISVTDANNCVSTQSFTVAEPDTIVVAGTTVGAGCAGGTNGSVTVAVTGGTTAYAYSWSNASTDQNVSNLAAGGYTLTVTDANSCVSTKAFTITEFALPTVTLSLTGKDTVCTTIGSVTLAGGSPTGGVYSGTGVSGTTMSTSVLGIHVITYTYTDGNSCVNSAKDSIYVDACAGIQDVVAENRNINVYPNPTAGLVTVDLVDFNNTQVTISVVNVIGEQVFKVVTTESKSTIDLHEMASGVYHVTVESKGFRITKRLVIDK